MTTITNLASILSAVVVTSYSTNIINSDNGEYEDCQTGVVFLTYPAQYETARHIVRPATERYERTTITEHKTLQTTLTNGFVLQNELTNRVVSDRIRTFRLIQTEEFVDEKDAPRLVALTPAMFTTNFITFTNAPTTNWLITLPDGGQP